MKSKILFFSLIFQVFLTSTNAQIKVSKDNQWSVRMTKSEMIRYPQAWQLDFQSKIKWDYCHGLELGAMLDVYDYYQFSDSAILNYVKGFGDSFVHADGTIQTYSLEEQSLDRINSGKIFFRLYERTKDEKYKKALALLRSQLNTQPRTVEGGFWHKNIYPHQMWLDGIYMGAPFYAEYAFRNNLPNDYADVIKQFLVVDEHTYDKVTHLNRHAWDESHEQKWADKTTGQSEHCWGRAYGWYAMALVDALDYIPVNVPHRIDLLKILNRVASQLEAYQDKTGEWYQVMDRSGAEGNYLESSCSAMFIYSLLKGVRKGYLPKRYLKVAEKAYSGYIKNFIKVDSDGLVTITNACAVAGLGGTPYRSGTYSYYIGEKKRNNDPKAVGPFIMASVEMERLSKSILKVIR